jgi:hypothetical protein
MRRAVDAAILELGSLNDRDRMLDCFFEYASSLFEFSVLFVLRGDNAVGRNVKGLGAPPGLVARLTFSVNEPGIFHRARSEKRPFLSTGLPTEADARLYGSIGRAMPMALVVPLVVRDRVVAFFVGDSPAATAEQRAKGAGRGSLEVVQDELLLWAASVGQALERLILRRKSGDSVPPGASTSAPPPPFPNLAPPPVPRIAIDRPIESSLPLAAPAEPPPPARRSTGAIVGVGVAAFVVAVAIAIFWVRSSGRERESRDETLVAAAKLPGWPNDVDPMALVDVARSASKVSADAELGKVEAQIRRGGKVDFDARPSRGDAASANVIFIASKTETEVRVTKTGLLAPDAQPRQWCGEHLCRSGLPKPKCSFAQVFEASLPAGLDAGDRVRVVYDRVHDAPNDSPPEFLVTTEDRGSVRLDATTCKPLPGQKFRPAALPIGKIPGAPASVDPLAVLPLARQQSGLESDAILLEIDARGIGENGRLDLNAPNSGITFTVADPIGSAVRRWRQVTVGREGIPIVGGDDDQKALPVRFFRAAIPYPKCTFADARAYLTLDAPSTEVQRVTYGPDLSGQAGQWSIESTGGWSRKTVPDAECGQWLKLKTKTTAGN